ncbi:hypothetical protein HFP72_29440 [Nocardiopsis sp. ARC36]
MTGVSGVEAAREVPGVERVVVTARPGQGVAPPVDAYGRVGYVIAVAGDRARVVDALTEAVSMVRVETSQEDEG